LFLAYLHEFSRVRNFYARTPVRPSWFAEEAGAIRYERDRRMRVAAILERQNRAFGSGEKSFANLERLRAGACTTVTGQQVGLFGGPLFAILKALTAVRMADEATRMGADCVPVFWLATEDHDLAEVNHVVLPAGEASLTRVETPTTAAPPDTPVGRIRFGPEIEPVVAQAASLLGGEMAELLRGAYAPGTSFGEAFGRVFARLFRDWGVILLDAADGELHALAAPLYQDVIRQAADLHARIAARGKELRDTGFHEQVKVMPSSTLLFGLQKGARTPVRREDGTFVLGAEKLSESALLGRISSAPEQFSPNVLLRPVVQDYLLPTLAYVGGPAEVAYFAQAAVVYETLLGRVTPILPRLTLTLVEPQVKRLLERYELSVVDTFQGPEQLRALLAERSLPADLQKNFDSAAVCLDEALRAITASLERLDRTLVDAAGHAGAKMRYQLDHLRTRAANAELRRSQTLERHAAQLSSALYPDRNLQERIIAGIYFLARHPDLLDSLYRTASFACLDHQVVFL
jgi:bacillithiol biosynthesis cysteine-adding enzyme BshC